MRTGPKRWSAISAGGRHHLLRNRCIPGLLRPDGKPAPAFAEVEHLSEELTLLPDVAPHQADVAIVFDYPSCWAWEVQPQGADFHYFRLVYEQYRAARSLGLSIDFVQSWSPQIPTYKLLLVPGLMTMPAILRDMLAQFQGTSLIGPRTNSKTTEFSIPSPLPPDLPGLDCTVEFVESLPPNVKYQLEGGGAFPPLGRAADRRGRGRADPP